VRERLTHRTHGFCAPNEGSECASDAEWPMGHDAVGIAVRTDDGCMPKCDRIVADALDALSVSGMTIRLCRRLSGRK